MNNTLQATFARRIAEIRKQRGLSQSDLARAIGVTPAAVCNYETGAGNATLKTVARFSAALNVEPEILLK